MNQRLAILPLMIAAAFACADDNVSEQSGRFQDVEVRADAKRVKAARSYSIASAGDFRDRVNLELLGQAKAFPAPITVVISDEKELENKESRTLIGNIAKNDYSTIEFAGEGDTIQDA